MNKMIVAVFDDQAQAYEGLTAIKELNSNGDISVYATAVINKNDEGAVSVKDTTGQGPVGTSVGILTGSFVGMLGGPVGVALGALTGSIGGMLYDLDKEDIDVTFVDEVSHSLSNGKTAVIADIEEGWNAPLDTRMDELNAMLFRKNRTDVEDEQFNREAEALDSELEELNAELEDAGDEARESIQKQIDKAKKKRGALKEALDKKMAKLKEETDAKKAELESQMKDANERKKKKLDKRKRDLEEAHKKSQERLSKASKKLSSSLT